MTPTSPGIGQFAFNTKWSVTRQGCPSCGPLTRQEGTRAGPGAALRDERWGLLWDVEAQDSEAARQTGPPSTLILLCTSIKNKQKPYFAGGSVQRIFQYGKFYE